MWEDMWNRWQQNGDLQERQAFSIETLAIRAFQAKGAGGQRPRSGENRAWMGQHIGLMGEQGKSSRAVGGKM